MSDDVICCTPKILPPHAQAQAVARARANNPANTPPLGVQAAVAAITGGEAGPPSPDHLAVLVARYWGSGGVHLTVGFLEEVDDALADRILLHANAWAEWCNVRFTREDDPGLAQVRITLEQQGYWSYLGTDVLSIPSPQATMCLQGFTMQTPEAEYRRVVRHEFGHTMGFPHEHARRQIVSQLDRRKTVAYFKKHYGWSQQMVVQQVLTPLEEASIMGTAKADARSIMTYDFPAQCTKTGKPIPGGMDIDEADRAFAARVYPPSTEAQPPPPVMAEAV